MNFEQNVLIHVEVIVVQLDSERTIDKISKDENLKNKQIFFQCWNISSVHEV